MGLMPKRPVLQTTGRATLAARPAPARKPVLIETDGYILRSLKPSDAGPTMAAWFDDPVVMAGLNLPIGGITHDHLRAYISEYDNYTKYIVGVFTKPDQRFIGYYYVSINLEHKVGTLSYIIGDPNYRQGHIQDRLGDMICEEFFTNRSIDKMVARVLANNYRALFMMKNSDFMLEGVFKKDNILPDGGRVDIVQFCRFRPGV